jgi:type I restriction enzyme, S subunit
MEVKSGYKQTEVGVIPIDWSTEYIENFADITTGSKNTRDRIEDGEYPFFVRSQIIERINSYSFDGEAVLTAGDGVGTGKVFHYINGKFDIHQRVYQIYNFAQHVNGYFFYLSFTANFPKRIMQMTAKSSVDSIRRNMISRMQLALPTTEDEQQLIVEALSDVDMLLDRLDQLIVKKHYLKQAAMQQLLTGQTRLPGFQGEWDLKCLGELLVYEQPTNYIVQSSIYNSSYDTPVLTAGKKVLLGCTNEKYGIFKKLPAIIFDDFTTASKYVDFEFKVKSSAIKILLPKNNSVNLKLVFQIMQMINFKVGEHKRHWISEYQKIEIHLPKPNEQTAIIQVLSNMQLEINSLLARQDKTRNLKQAMIKELLSGKTRLIEPKELHA